MFSQKAANGKWTWIYKVLFQSTDHSKSFTTPVTFTHSHTFKVPAAHQERFGVQHLAQGHLACQMQLSSALGSRDLNQRQSLDNLLYPLPKPTNHKPKMHVLISLFFMSIKGDVFAKSDHLQVYSSREEWIITKPQTMISEKYKV